jgi:hypothetical protein
VHQAGGVHRRRHAWRPAPPGAARFEPGVAGADGVAPQAVATAVAAATARAASRRCMPPPSAPRLGPGWDSDVGPPEWRRRAADRCRPAVTTRTATGVSCSSLDPGGIGHPGEELGLRAFSLLARSVALSAWALKKKLGMAPVVTPTSVANRRPSTASTRRSIGLPAAVEDQQDDDAQIADGDEYGAPLRLEFMVPSARSMPVIDDRTCRSHRFRSRIGTRSGPLQAQMPFGPDRPHPLQASL